MILVYVPTSKCVAKHIGFLLAWLPAPTLIRQDPAVFSHFFLFYFFICECVLYELGFHPLSSNGANPNEIWVARRDVEMKNEEEVSRWKEKCGGIEEMVKKGLV